MTEVKKLPTFILVSVHMVRPGDIIWLLARSTPKKYALVISSIHQGGMKWKLLLLRGGTLSDRFYHDYDTQVNVLYEH